MKAVRAKGVDQTIFSLITRFVMHASTISISSLTTYISSDIVLLPHYLDL